MTNLISILIPNYNKAPYLKETLDSIVNQTYTNWECIIVDDHSTDNSWEILTEYAKRDPRFRLFNRPTYLPKGGNFCRNYAFEQSTGDFIQWFDSDDIMHPKLLFNRISKLDGTEYDFVLGNGLRFSKMPHDSETVFSPLFYKGHFLESFLELDPAWLTPSGMFKKIFLDLNKIYWHESINVLQDVLYNLEVFSKSKKFLILKGEPDWHWRNHADGENVGAKRNRIESLPSINKIIQYLHKYIRNEETRNSYLIGLNELVDNTQNRFSLRWFKYICSPIYKVGFLSLSNLIILIFRVLWFYLLKIFNNETALKTRSKSIAILKSEIVFVKRDKVMGQKKVSDFQEELLKLHNDFIIDHSI